MSVPMPVFHYQCQINGMVHNATRPALDLTHAVCQIPKIWRKLKPGTLVFVWSTLNPNERGYFWPDGRCAMSSGKIARIESVLEVMRS